MLRNKYWFCILVLDTKRMVWIGRLWAKYQLIWTCVNVLLFLSNNFKILFKRDYIMIELIALNVVFSEIQLVMVNIVNIGLVNRLQEQFLYSHTLS